MPHEPCTRLINAVVVSAGRMQKTVKVRVGGMAWNKHIRKSFHHPRYHLCHDPNNSLRTGDVIEMSPGWGVAKNVRHVVDKIVAPFGTKVEDRPPVPTLEQRVAERERKRALKLERRAAKKAEEAAAVEETAKRLKQVD